MFGIGIFEVGLAQGPQVFYLRPRAIGWMFTECNLVMILVQVFVLAPLLRRIGSGLLAPAFLTMAAGVALLSFATTYILLVGVDKMVCASPAIATSLFLCCLLPGNCRLETSASREAWNSRSCDLEFLAGLRVATSTGSTL